VSESISEAVELPESLSAPPIAPYEPTPNNPPWGSGIAIGVWLLSVGLIVIVPGIFLAPYAISLGSVYPDSAELVKAMSTDPIAIAIQIAAVVPAHLLTIAVAWLVVTKGRKYPFTKTLGWLPGGMKWWHYGVILAAFFCLALAVGNILPETENELTRILNSSRYIVFLVAFMATFTAPLVEEVIYRGILYSALQRSVGVGFGVAIVTLLFALVHFPQYYPSISTMVLLTLLSLILTLVRVRTNNLLPCVILHTIFNGFQSILLIAHSSLKVDSTADDAITALFHLFK
jgi:membrane protease YdiL (CAAX protease family)